MPRPLEGGRFYGATLQKRCVSGLVLVDSLHPADSRLPRHAHERAYFCLNRGGTYVEHYGRRTRTCQKGMLTFHPPGEVHTEAHGAESVRSFNVELGPEWLSHVLECAGPLDRPAEFRGDAVAEAGFQLFREFDRADDDSALAIESLTLEILARTSGGRDAAADTDGPRWLRDARDLLDTCLHAPVTLRTLAQEAGVHPVYFAAIFRRVHRASVGEYVRRRRLEYARRKLVDPEIPLSEIAVEAGFTDQSHFTRTFKRFTGVTPGQYRASLATLLPTFLPFKTR